MRKKERPTLIPIEYPLFLEALKKELAKNPGTTLTAFCKKHAIDYGFSTDGSEPSGRVSTSYAVKRVQVPILQTVKTPCI